MAMVARQSRKPLDQARLDELALSYVSRFATSRSKLKNYLVRKLRERGWTGEGEPPIDALADRMTRLGYVDDQAYALSKARTLTARGYGAGRVRQALAQAGIADENSTEARDLAATEAFDAALRFARRRSLGPFASARPEGRDREKAIAAMLRAGHAYGIARDLIDLEPGEFPENGADERPV
jgi:regulatory protein